MPEDGADDLATRHHLQGRVGPRPAAALRRGDDGAHVNFVNDEGPERARGGCPCTPWDRLAAIRARHRPEHPFRRNHTIPPAA